MANPAHLDILRHGVPVWNQWRRDNVSLRPDLKGADLRKLDLVHIDFYGTDLRSANLAGAHLNAARENVGGKRHSSENNAGCVSPFSPSSVYRTWAHPA
jgi:hypothetical protein